MNKLRLEIRRFGTTGGRSGLTGAEGIGGDWGRGGRFGVPPAPRAPVLAGPGAERLKISLPLSSPEISFIQIVTA